MTLPSRMLIRCALFYLVSGAFLGMLLLLNKAWFFSDQLWILLPVHIELMLFGWVIQLTIGVAYWILPRYLSGEVRGNPVWAYVMITLLNMGILLMVLADLDVLNTHFRVIARVSELLAVLLFISLHWKRIVTYNP